jgi:predicted AAA+ superfamily ATPase
MLVGLSKYAGQVVRQRASSPKFQVLDSALFAAMSGRTFAEARSDPEFWGRVTEIAVGAHLANAAACDECDLFYWRDGGHEVDFVVRVGRKVVAIEVKSSRSRTAKAGLLRFAAAFRTDRKLLVGGDGIPVADFLLHPIQHWTRDL